MSVHLPTTAYIILGFLLAGPATGYEIKQSFDRSCRFFWNVSFGQIYPSIRRLVQEGYVRRQRERRDGGPDRFVLSLTPAGREAVVSWLQEPAEPGAMKDEFLLKLFFSGATGPETVKERLRQQAARHRARLQVYREIDRVLRPVAAGDRLLRFQWYTLDLGMLLERAYLTWVDRVLASIESERMPVFPEEGGGGARPDEGRSNSP